MNCDRPLSLGRPYFVSALFIVPLCAVCTFAAATAFASVPAPGEGKATAPQPDRKDANDSRPPFTISKETTRITKPLTKDGYVDYVAALNQQLSEGVTVENNAAVPFSRALGPQVVDERFRAEYFDKLGIAVPHKKGEYFVTWEDYLKGRGMSEDDLWAPDSAFTRGLQATEKPWTRDDYPLVFDWLEANEVPLNRIVKGIQRPRWSMPVLAEQDEEGEPPYIGPLRSVTQVYRDVARALTARAMLRIKKGAVPEAWHDLLAVHRFARHVGREPIAISRLVAIALDLIAAHGDFALAHSGKLTSKQAANIITDLESLPPMPEIVEIFDVGERYSFLNTAQWFARHQDEMKAEGAEDLPGGIGALLGGAAGAQIDWDTLLRMGNEHYDRLVAAASKSDPVERLKATRKFTREYEEMLKEKGDELESFGGIVKLLFSGKKLGRLVAESISHVMLGTLAPAVDLAVSAELHRTARLDLVRIAFALAAHRSDHGRYPDKLAALSPKYLTDLPHDPFAGRDFGYVPKDDGYMLYSIGPNGKDEGGDTIPPSDDVVVERR